jgi:DNA helicase-2/ATP-dependent DNA helicase PcrA
MFVKPRRDSPLSLLDAVVGGAAAGCLYSSRMDIVADLNPEQRAAAEHRGGPLLVVAGAGTGKTLTLAARVAWLVAQGVDPQRLLLLTFSRRAAGEMARRAGRLLHASLGLSTRTPPPVLPWCGTFHSVGARLLREEAARIGLPEGFTVLDRADAQDLMAMARQHLGLAASETRFPMAPTCLAIHSRCINTRQPLATVLAQTYPWCTTHEAAWRACSRPLARPSCSSTAWTTTTCCWPGGT